MPNPSRTTKRTRVFGKPDQAELEAATVRVTSELADHDAKKGGVLPDGMMAQGAENSASMNAPGADGPTGASPIAVTSAASKQGTRGLPSFMLRDQLTASITRSAILRLSLRPGAPALDAVVHVVSELAATAGPIEVGTGDPHNPWSLYRPRLRQEGAVSMVCVYFAYFWSPALSCVWTAPTEERAWPDLAWLREDGLILADKIEYASVRLPASPRVEAVAQLMRAARVKFGKTLAGIRLVRLRAPFISEVVWASEPARKSDSRCLYG